MSQQYNSFDVIYKYLKTFYPEQEGIFHAPIRSWAEGGNSPLDSVVVFKNENRFWHYVSLGFSELYEKESDDKDISGYGFELSFRLKFTTETEPPSWPSAWIQSWARYVFDTGHIFHPPDYADNEYPIDHWSDSAIKSNRTGILFLNDTTLKDIGTPNGKVNFISMVGVSPADLAEAKKDIFSFGETFSKQDDFYITDLAITF